MSTDTTPFYPGEVVWGRFPSPPPAEEPGIQVVDVAHMDPEAIPAVEAAKMLEAHGIPCRLRYLVGKTPRGIRLTKLPNVAPIPADKQGYVPFPLIQHFIREIGRFEDQFKSLTGDAYEYQVDKKPAHDNDK